MTEPSGFASLTFSPDDESATGKGWYARTLNKDGSIRESSPLFETKREAVDWARENGASRFLGGNF